MRKNCNHPDLITGPFSASTMYPPPDVLVEQCGKLALMQRLLDRLKAGGHKVLIFSQVGALLISDLHALSALWPPLCAPPLCGRLVPQPLLSAALLTPCCSLAAPPR